MQLPRIMMLLAITLVLGACQASLPNALQPDGTNPNYPSPGTPITLANNPAYPDPNAPPSLDPAYPTPAELPTAEPAQPVAPPENPIPVNTDMPQLSQGANLQQPGEYVVKIISVSTGNQLIVSNDTSEQMVTLVGIITVDPAEQGDCANLSRDRLTLLTANPTATYTMTVIQPDPNNPSIVIGKLVRHDTIDLGLDLVASGLALLNSEQFAGRENYIALVAAAKAENLGRWNEPCKFSDAIIGTQQA